MSKVGYNPITIDAGVTVTVEGSTVNVKGSKGSLTIILPGKIQARVENSEVKISRDGETKQIKSLHGTYRSLIANAVHGVNKGWEKRLEVVGTGFSVTMKNEDAHFKVGYSHPVVFEKVEGLQYAVDGQNILIISGVDRQLVGQTAYKARSIKKPDPYKGKGVRYAGEVIKLKAGKKTKAA